MRALKRNWMPRAALAALLVLGIAGPGAAQEVASRDGGESRWVTTWSAAQAPPGPTTIDAIFGNDHSRAFENHTIRNIAHTSVGGRRVRVRLSNVFGAAPLRIGAAQVARRSFGASIYPQTNRRLTFSGQASILVPVGAVAVSDAVDLEVPSASDLAVSIYLPGPTGLATFHEQTMQTSYIADGGNFVSTPDLPTTSTTLSAFFLSVVEVLPADSLNTLVVIGDSITQGAGSTVDANLTWPDQLSARLNAHRPRLAVINQGIGGGRLLWDFAGQGGAARFDRDVLTVTGANRVIVALGINDIMIPSILPIFGRPEFAPQAVSAAEIITGLQQVIQRARAQGFRVYGATLAPLGSSTTPGAFTPENEAKRQAVNRWIRTGGAYDGVVDVDAAVRDPANPVQLLPRYNADGIHFTDAGYQAVANSINLSMLF